ncbi:DNA polymerase III subunit epsilon [bacterium (Candidatus Blackallbacteria) CG17_big_fil_post_rev_8_21_14_2_50_48_46]|uniref:DNA polymerase III subunit epsilon n=1 Tax=bacterium (Candidatus Blackallbacteria) CG17_big_fil_post_rev_8_21_14_2_50_48_46 TaxID=2014261 RepID=A0A2M7G107_9BACT|nr:MAG: DNA polymerase III subunit epsilon [bacterium (Candidatus Blackallbacteria) CG18_big_fil_WC_8_21_14_2_50_49_26]PIW15369.1 MAG: DNA polymerase III subunit epsilon [bacterium (Candidatus Blackallbacteria) CG17_big_fil_post_rev_8_21_14_2_50_48_46]PIW49770.1 MAG: DNA polymerase III subunit epsilon [bacterium (Candidatus Blackallbacteria) CG13_big_fil_rev_8_21_14_2_50_49_14]
MNLDFHPTHQVVILDFETTGVSPTQGDRAIEIGAVRLRQGKIAERFQSLINPGFRISRFIEDYTGISNAMLKEAPAPEQVMLDFVKFLGSDGLIAHNASFDQRFLEAELARLKRPLPNAFACSMLLARRVFPEAPNHKLGSLVDFLQLPHEGTFHRALADAEMTAHLWLKMMRSLENEFPQTELSFDLIQRLSKTDRSQLKRLMQAHAAKGLF